LTTVIIQLQQGKRTWLKLFVSAHSPWAQRGAQVMLGFICSLAQKYSWLDSLKSLSSDLWNIEIKTGAPTLTNDEVAIIVIGAACASISDQRKFVAHFFPKHASKIDIVAAVREVVLKQVAADLTEITVPELIASFDNWSSAVMKHCQSTLKPMGLTLTFFGIKELSDKSGYFHTLGLIKNARLLEETGDFVKADEAWRRAAEKAEQLSPKCALSHEVSEDLVAFLKRTGSKSLLPGQDPVI
jgi:uncharacterized membrane protein YqiK